MTSLKGKTVLLTGASRGLGVYIARNLAKEQATIVGVSRSKLRLDKVSEEITAIGGKWISIPFDITNVAEIPTLATQIHELAGPVDILINNAGIEMYRNFFDYSFEEMQSILTTNLISAVAITRLLLPSMLERRSWQFLSLFRLFVPWLLHHHFFCQNRRLSKMKCYPRRLLFLPCEVLIHF